MDYDKIFSADLVARIKSLHNELCEVLPSPDLDDWIRGFIGENRPENEVRIFEAIAVVYREVLAEHDLSLEHQKELYSILVMASCGYMVPNIDERLPPGSPGYDELAERWERAFIANN
jgi:hypothetical protein